ncbi:metalloregulator ArsR/SmtB family transcription factor [Streptomyces sp. NPDC002935]|uniref:ArsR/SmtB family transcription factor n=1 Tax=unclassified Streptomyces TaxID=2593676 RepID=UPI0033307211
MHGAPDSAHSAAYDRVFAALAHPTRRQILITLHFEGGSMGAGDIARMFEHAWPTTSRHLQVMEDAGLVTHERHGRTRIYRMNRQRVALVSDWLGLIRGTGS